MALSRLHTWISGEVLTASDLNGEFNNIVVYVNALSFSALIADGTVAAPGLAFAFDTDTGIYRIGANALGVSAGGATVFVASEFFQASAFLFPVKTATEAVRTAMPGRAYWQSAEGSLHIHTGTIVARVPAIAGLQAGDFIVATNPSGVQGATVYARGKFSTGLSVSTTTGEVTVATASVLFPIPTVTVFTATASGSIYTPPSNVRYLDIELAGGGGGGAGGGAGGTNGTIGNLSMFNSSTLVGGAGGGGTQGGGGSGGAGTGGNIVNFAGGGGNGGSVNVANTPGGAGGSNIFGGAGQAGNPASAGGTAAINTGGGGGGGGTGAVSSDGGGGGAGGYVRHRISPASASYTYSVGGGAKGGDAGTSGGKGGDGAPGIIIITEHYI